MLQDNKLVRRHEKTSWTVFCRRERSDRFGIRIKPACGKKSTCCNSNVESLPFHQQVGPRSLIAPERVDPWEASAGKGSPLRQIDFETFPVLS
jgi:hypothetical protein